MGISQWFVDIYDYKIPYYRYYISRRILFRNDTEKNLDTRVESLFANKDYENFDLILRKSAKYFTYGGFIGYFV
jgi:hypothetical protein